MVKEAKWQIRAKKSSKPKEIKQGRLKLKNSPWIKLPLTFSMQAPP
jgi:hypothetical protein